MSSFFQTFPASSDFGPLFRLLDDYDVHRSQPTRSSNGSRGSSSIRAFQPRFDVKEIKDAYELHGELPGIDQKDVSIEFADPHTLVIKGRTEREYSSGSGSAGAIEDSASSTGRITEGDSSKESSYHKATVEDEEGANKSSTPEPSSTEVAKRSSETELPKASHHKYWVSERMVGEFHRSFSFPTRVDQDAVKASLKNGILSITVPKATAPQSRKIQIQIE
ncbi:MAG: hypothetical protein LQ347_001894 [Umbilicaria vellea]|nr:MAG: hypothetical protein LQ347_001894 [Umbilicaria vellea]